MGELGIRKALLFAGERRSCGPNDATKEIRGTSYAICVTDLTLNPDGQAVKTCPYGKY